MEEEKLLCYVKEILFSFLLFVFVFNGAKANNIKDNTDYTNMGNIFNQYKNLKENRLKENNNDNNIYVFISFSMANNMIKNYFEEAIILKQKQNIDVVFVLRGFYKNSFKETTKKIAEMTQENNNKPLGIIVDPLLFREYNITQVPTIIQKNDDDYDKITGSITIKYALEKFNGGKGE